MEYPRICHCMERLIFHNPFETMNKLFVSFARPVFFTAPGMKNDYLRWNVTRGAAKTIQHISKYEELQHSKARRKLLQVIFYGFIMERD